MFDTSSFRIRYKARLEKPGLLLIGPILVALLVVVASIDRFVLPLSFGRWIRPDLLALLLPIGLIAALAVLIELVWGGDEGYPWRRSIAATGAGLTGGTLLVGAWGKLLDPVSFQASLSEQGLTGLVPATVVALVAIGLELLLGGLLVLGVRRVWVLVASGLLVAFFLFLTGRAYVDFLQGVEAADSSCGCFGNLLDRTPAEAFWQDFLLLVPGLLLVGLGIVVRTPTFKRSVLAVLVTAGGVATAWFAPSLPLDDLATRLRPGLDLAAVCSGRGDERLCLLTLLPGLEQGSHLVVLADLEDESFGDAVSALNEYTLAAAGPTLWVVAAATPEQSQAFFWAHGPSFEIHEAPASLIRPLYRTLPRSFRVEDGRVTETFSGLPPELSSAGGAPEEEASVSPEKETS